MGFRVTTEWRGKSGCACVAPTPAIASLSRFAAANRLFSWPSTGLDPRRRFAGASVLSGRRLAALDRWIAPAGRAGLHALVLLFGVERRGAVQADNLIQEDTALVPGLLFGAPAFTIEDAGVLVAPPVGIVPDQRSDSSEKSPP